MAFFTQNRRWTALYQPLRQSAPGFLLAVGLAACTSLPSIPLTVPVLSTLFGPPALGLDQIDQERAFDAAEAALNSGEDQGWSNPETGNRGEFHPGPAYEANQRETCRDFTHAIYKPGASVPYEITGTACRRSGQTGWRVQP